MAARKKKVTPPAAPPATPPAAPPPKLCRKCGHDSFVTQIRNVSVTIGWKLSVVQTVAPCAMCQKCGNVSVSLTATPGELAGLIPDPAIVKARQAQQAAAAPVTKDVRKPPVTKPTRKKKASKKKASKKKASKKR